ncbi:MAG TPA: hypothetical protein VN238_09895 [Solirubrobacteraceae bacterium]|nr:hypothetical protein [Solirubrobacteraceae bacterium]
MERARYHDAEPADREVFERALTSGDEETAAHALVGLAFHDPDWRWVQDHCLALIADPASPLRRLAATCLSHLARIHRTHDADRVMPVLRAMAEEPGFDGGTAQDALEDIEIFIGRRRV